MSKYTQERLNMLNNRGFIAGWEERAGKYWVNYPGAYRWYSLEAIEAWLDGAETNLFRETADDWCGERGADTA